MLYTDRFSVSTDLFFVRMRMNGSPLRIFCMRARAATTTASCCTDSSSIRRRMVW